MPALCSLFGNRGWIVRDRYYEELVQREMGEDMLQRVCGWLFLVLLFVAPAFVVEIMDTLPVKQTYPTEQACEQ